MVFKPLEESKKQGRCCFRSVIAFLEGRDFKKALYSPIGFIRQARER